MTEARALFIVLEHAAKAISTHNDEDSSPLTEEQAAWNIVCYLMQIAQRKERYIAEVNVP
jgi:hypothetical protein